MPLSARISGIILKKTTLRERDVLVVVFSKELGKVMLVGKGARSNLSRRGMHLQTGSFVDIVYQKTSSGLYIRDCILVSALYEVKRQETAAAMLMKSLFLLDRLLPSETPEPEIYQEFISFCRTLSEGGGEPTRQIDLTLFASTLLVALGFQHTTSTAWLEVKRQVEEVIEERVP